MAGEPRGALVPVAREELMRRIRSATERIWLASPFLSLPVAEEIAEAAAKSPAAERKLLTDASERSVAVGVLDADGLEQLHEAEFEIVDIDDLHAKVSLVDSAWGLVGSGNLTGKGLGDEKGGGNYELGVILTAKQIEKASAFLADWLKEGKEVDAAEIERLKQVEKVPWKPKRRRKRRPSLPFVDVAGLKEFLDEEVPLDNPPRYWIDANYHSRVEETWWQERRWISGQRKVAYTEGDLIVIYLGAKNEGPKRCPAIVRATTNTKTDRKFVEDNREDDPEAPKRWPNVTHIEVLGEVSGPIGSRLGLIKRDGKPLTGKSLRRGFLEITRPEFDLLATAMTAQAP
ncbi:MAG TPA: phospholipase D-like domain-containing protein [Solirubrobacterales bacterium]|nr:phospholipase D-like domain-containing protein [Solirubrobacterales bacterium]